MNILLIMGEGCGIGNIIQMSPAIQALGLQVPGINVYTFGNSLIGQILSGLNVISIPNLHTSMMFDYVFVMFFGEGSYQSNFNMIKKTCKNEIIYLPLGDVGKEHEADIYIKIPRFFGYTGARLPTYCDNVCVSPSWTQGEQVVVISDTSAPHEIWKRKRWPYFRTLAGMLHELGFSIALIGGKHEAENFDAKGWPPFHNLMGKLSLPETAGIIKQCSFFIGNDTGPTHISAALGVITFAIFGPTSIRKNAPLGPKVTIISHKLVCQPCQENMAKWHACSDWRCMHELMPHQVLKTILTNRHMVSVLSDLDRQRQYAVIL